MRLYEIVYEDSIGNQNRITVLAHTLKEAFEICKHQGVTPIAGNEMPIFTALGLMLQRGSNYIPADTDDFENGEP